MNFQFATIDVCLVRERRLSYIQLIKPQLKGRKPLLAST
jgi:hypothetical protein